MKKATLAQRDKLWDVVMQDGTPRDQMQRLIASGLFSDLLHADYWHCIDRDGIRHALGLKPFTYSIDVDYDLPFAKAFRSHPHVWWNEDITDEHFPPEGTGMASLEIRLIHYDKDMTTEEINIDFIKRKLRPAGLRELLAFGKRYPKVHVDGGFSIIALDFSAWVLDGEERICKAPGLDHDEEGAGLGLFDIKTIWRADRDFHFAGIVL